MGITPCLCLGVLARSVSMPLPGKLGAMSKAIKEQVTSVADWSSHAVVEDVVDVVAVMVVVVASASLNEIQPTRIGNLPVDHLFVENKKQL